MEERTLLETIRQGKAGSHIKREASRGGLPVSADELLEILVFLTRDPDFTCAEEAKKTLASWPPQKCAAALAHPETSADTLDYFAAQPSLPDEIRAAILAHPNAGDEALVRLASSLSPEEVEAIVSEPGRLAKLPRLAAALRERKLPKALRAQLTSSPAPSPEVEKKAEAAAPRGEEPDPKVSAEEKRERMSLGQKIARLSIPERVQLALKGSREERMILVRDPAKVVYRAALSSPRMNESDAEAIAVLKNVADEVPRLLAANRAYIKNYVVVRNLLNNPRTPIDVSLPLLTRLTERDLKALGLNRNIPDTVRAMAVKLMKKRAMARR